MRLTTSILSLSLALIVGCASKDEEAANNDPTTDADADADADVDADADADGGPDTGVPSDDTGTPTSLSFDGVETVTWDHSDGLVVSWSDGSSEEPIVYTVHVTTASGRLIATLTSEGGRAIWNGKDLSGTDVPYGVYLVFATDADGKSSGTTKIAVIR